MLGQIASFSRLRFVSPQSRVVEQAVVDLYSVYAFLHISQCHDGEESDVTVS